MKAQDWYRAASTKALLSGCEIGREEKPLPQWQEGINTYQTPTLCPALWKANTVWVPGSKSTFYPVGERQFKVSGSTDGSPDEWVALSSSGHLLELQILRYHPRTKELETLAVGSSSLVHKLCQWFRFMLNLKNLCFRLSTSRGINQWTRHMELRAADRKGENSVLYSKMLNWAVSSVRKGLEEGGSTALSRPYFLGEEVLSQVLRNE